MALASDMVAGINEPIHAFGAVYQLLREWEGNLEVDATALWYLLGMLHERMLAESEKLELALMQPN